MSLRKEKLDFWLKTSKSVLLIGRSGVGKTAIALETFQRNNLVLGANVAYYSPHDGDLIGDLNEAQVIFFDDLGNDEKAQQAAQEILAIGCWRGQPITTRSVWACTKPYATEAAGGCDTVGFKWKDPSVFGRFEVKVEIAYQANLEYLSEKYGEKVAKAAVQWWVDLDRDCKDACSPRRLDQGLQMWKEKPTGRPDCRWAKGDIRDVLPPLCDISKLLKLLATSAS